MKVFLVILAFSLLLIGGASAGGQASLGGWQGGGQGSPWIEQEDDWPQGFNCLDSNGQALSNCDPRVISEPAGFNCLWSVNEHEFLTSTGYLDPGVSVSRSKCVVSDYDPISAWRNGSFSSHWTNAVHGMSTASLVAKSSDLRLSVCFYPQGRCFSPLPVYDPAGRAYESTFCGQAHYRRDDPAVVEIPGSNGGHGVITTVTTTFTNVGTRRVRDVYASVGYASDIALFKSWPDAYGCLLADDEPRYTYVNTFDYPFSWVS